MSTSNPAGVDDPQIVAQWLRDRRKAANKTQAELASDIGVGSRSILRWENGQNRVRRRRCAY